MLKYMNWPGPSQNNNSGPLLPDYHQIRYRSTLISGATLGIVIHEIETTESILYDLINILAQCSA